MRHSIEHDETFNAPSPGAASRVLVAEDHEINRRLIRALLAVGGVSPHVVEDGAQAVLAWETGEWDVILMDIQMPELDGISAARLIRAREQESGRPRTPIIAVTCNTSRENAGAYAAAGMDGLVAKPIAFASLMAAMAQAANLVPARTAAQPYRPFRVVPAGSDDGSLPVYIAGEMKRLGIGRPRATSAPA